MQIQLQIICNIECQFEQNGESTDFKPKSNPKYIFE